MQFKYSSSFLIIALVLGSALCACSSDEHVCDTSIDAGGIQNQADGQVSETGGSDTAVHIEEDIVPSIDGGHFYEDGWDPRNPRKFKVRPVVNHFDLPNKTILNKTTMDLLKFTVTAVGGDISMKQFRFSFGFLLAFDHHPTNLSMSDFRFYKDGNNIGSSVNILDRNANNLMYSLVSNSNAENKADQYMVVSFKTEDVILEDQTTTYTLRGVPNGFSVSNGVDKFMISFGPDSNPGSVTPYINEKWFEGSGIWTMRSVASPAASSCNYPSCTETLYSWIWSDMSDPAHVSSGNELSTGDWKNAYFLGNYPYEIFSN